MQPLSLFELNRMVSEVLTLSLNDNFWVVAEIASLNEHVSGHCYLELIEKAETGFTSSDRLRIGGSGGGKFKAQARATVWRSVWTRILPKFRRETGQYIAPGMKVLLQVKVTFHEVYGYSLNVSDIDPTYTIGDMARRRQEILQQLEDDGVLHLNKELPLPRPLQRIAVVSAAGAAGYGDFCQQLDESGFRFATKLFPATLQGSEVESSVIHALDSIAAELDDWDCVVIIRGGGAVADLNGFETYLLAANVAQFPLPVLTGIGHERDDTVIDFVAHTRLKTPTAVAQFLIDSMRNELDLVADFDERLHSATTALLFRNRQHYDAAAHRFERAAANFISQQREHLLRLSSRSELSILRQLERQRTTLDRQSSRLEPAALRLIEREHHRQALIEKSLLMAGPDRILRMGYTITTDAEGNVLRSVNDAAPGTFIKTQMADGVLTSQIVM